MKLSVTTGIIVVCLLAFAWTSSAEAPPRKRHRAVPQVDPSAPPGSVPRAPGLPIFPSQAKPQGVNPQFQAEPVMRSNPYQQALPPIVTPTPRKRVRRGDEEIDARRSGTSSVRRVPAKRQPGSKAESADHAHGAEASKRSQTSRQEAEQSSQDRHTRPSTAERNGTERSIVVPTRTLPTPVTTPQARPEPVEMAPPAVPPPSSAVPVQVAPQVTSAVQPQPVQAQADAHQPGLRDLSEDERAKLHSAHQAALNDPNLAASRDRYLKARRDFREKLRNALLKADPSVQPILEKIRREKRDER